MTRDRTKLVRISLPEKIENESKLKMSWVSYCLSSQWMQSYSLTTQMRDIEQYVSSVGDVVCYVVQCRSTFGI